MRSAGGIAVVLLLVLAGCVGNQDSGAQDNVEEGFGLGTSSLIGVVVSEQLEPIQAAQVQVDDLDPVTTDRAGRFAAHGLSAGSHAVVVAAIGFEGQNRSVDLSPDEELEIRFTLTPVPVAAPYIDVTVDRGYSACDYMLLVLTGRIPPPCNTGQEPKTIFTKDVDEPWRFHVVELSWQSTSSFEESMRLFASDDMDCASESPCYGLVYGRDYARLEGEPGKTDVVTHYDPWEDGRGPEYPNGSFEMILNVQWIGLLVDEANSVPAACQTIFVTVTGAGYKRGCVGVGISTGVPFDLYTSIFYWDGPSDRGACCPATAYTAMPDQ